VHEFSDRACGEADRCLGFCRRTFFMYKWSSSSSIAWRLANRI
jgi:hypothetical protein